jgi:hypothetical protein
LGKQSRIYATATILAVLTGQWAWAASAGSPTSAASNHLAGTSSDTSERLEEVTVIARRADLAAKVAEFVSQIAARENEEGLPRWRIRVCPLVSGLPRQEGEFVLGRVSDIAREVGVPVAGEHCRPNLFVLVTADPKGLLQKWDNRNSMRRLVFGEATPFVTDEFIKTPRPVRVWYRTIMRTPEDTPPNEGLGTVASVSGSGLRGVMVYNDRERTSHILLSKIWSFEDVFVIADQAPLHELTIGQFADYVAMVGLAKLKSGPHLGDVPTILKLFDKLAEAAPTGITNWDQTFLKFLYATEQLSKQQRGQIAREMVREIAP